MIKKEIDQKYLDEHEQLENEYLDIIDEGLPSQHRVLKPGKDNDEFVQKHGGLWKRHEAELIANGFAEPMPEPIISRDLETEIDELRAEIEKLKAG